jgi:hypothetical protein
MDISHSQLGMRIYHFNLSTSYSLQTSRCEVPVLVYEQRFKSVPGVEFFKRTIWLKAGSRLSWLLVSPSFQFHAEFGAHILSLLLTE